MVINMHSLYEIVNATVHSDSMDVAKEILFGFDEFSANIDEYYKRIISSFVKKKDIIINQENGKLIFDLENVNDLWSIIFISTYIKRELENIDLKIKEKIDELRSEYETLQQRARTERINLGKELKKVGKQKNSLEKKREEVLKCLNGFFNLDSFPYSIEFEQNVSMKEETLKMIKESIKAIHILRNVVEHGKVQNDSDIVIDNYSVQISIPATYLDGFNKGKIIAREKDRIIVEKTNKIIYPILEKFNYDTKTIESFFYSLEPSYLSYLLKLCDYKTENLYRLPYELYYRKDFFILIISELKKAKSIDVLQDEDYEFLNNIHYGLGSNYYKNIILLLRNNNNLKLPLNELPEIARIFFKVGLDPWSKTYNINEANDILHNYLKIKTIYLDYSSVFNASELPYSIFCKPLDDTTNIIIKKIIRIKQMIDSNENDYKDELNYWFNSFIKDHNLFIFLDDIINIFDNVDSYAPDKNKYQYITSLLLDILGQQVLRMNSKETYNFRKINEVEKKTIEEIINRYKNNCDIHYDLEKDNQKKAKIELRTIPKSKKEYLLNVIKKSRDENTPISRYLKSMNVEDIKYIYLLQLSQYDHELNYLIDKTNDYDVSIEIIIKLSQHINSYVPKYGDIYDKEYDSLLLQKVNNVKSNFKRNIDKLLSKYKPEDLLKFPSEIFYSSEIMFDVLFSRYNENLCKSIFGIENPKIIGTLLYANSVFSQYQKEDLKSLDINFDAVIHNCFNDTYKYRHNITDVAVTQESYLSQFLLDGDEQRDYQSIKSNIMNKFRNSFAHFRFKQVKDEKGNIVPDKIYLYDKYEELDSNNFNIIIDLKDLVELTRQIEIGLSKKKGLPIDDESENKFKVR